jgi:hypothetical protein
MEYITYALIAQLDTSAMNMAFRVLQTLLKCHLIPPIFAQQDIIVLQRHQTINNIHALLGITVLKALQP